MNTNRDIITVDEAKAVAPVPQASEGAAILSMIERAARDPSVDIEKFERLMAMRERVETRAAQIAFSAAVSEAKAEIRPISKNATGHNDKKYANFSAYATEVDPILSKHGLSYRFRSTQTDKISVTCILSHRDGHSEETTLSGPADTTGNKNAIQAIGSTLTYLQRYSLVLSLGLASAEDDDGKAAGASKVEYITEDQVIALRDILESYGVNEQTFCKAIKVERIAEIYANKYQDVIALIHQRKGARQ